MHAANAAVETRIDAPSVAVSNHEGCENDKNSGKVIKEGNREGTGGSAYEELCSCKNCSTKHESKYLWSKWNMPLTSDAFQPFASY